MTSGIPLRNIEYSIDVLEEEHLAEIITAAHQLFNWLVKIPFENPAKRIEPYQVKDFWPFLATMTPKQIAKEKYRFNILPLHRVGAQEGASGSRVFVAYFSIDGKEHEHSNPLLLKFQVIGEDIEEKKDHADKLKAELRQAEGIMPYVRGNSSYFAFPIKHVIQEKLSILWALFTSAIFDKEQADNVRPELKEDNLWKVFESIGTECAGDDAKLTLVRDSIANTFRVMWPLHKRYRENCQERRVLQDEYKWYLRDQELWLPAMLSCLWEPASSKTVKDFNEEWPNPLYVFEQLKGYESEITLGSIHGDLHTKNIIFGPQNSVRIIDFGWTQERSHVAKDFILLESNMRFMLLHPCIHFDDLRELTKTIADIDSGPIFRSDYVAFVHDVIRQIRRAAFEILNPDNIFDEYLIPLFYLSLGLLKFAKTINNVTSARLTILQLSTEIQQFLDDRTQQATAS